MKMGTIAPGNGAAGDRGLWLVRHGESTWNAMGLVQGQMDPGLSPSGRRQAAECAWTLAAQPRPEALYSSDLWRALDSAVPIGEVLGLEVRVEGGLRERSLGEAEGSPWPTLGADRSGVAKGRVVDPDAAPAGGESVRQLYDRVASCAARILSVHHGDVVLVCHGGVVRVLLAWLDGIGPDEMAWPDVQNGVPILRKDPCALSCA